MPVKQKGFTLLELLVAVAIFSGLAVLTLGVFARSAASSLKTGESRKRTEVARSIVDRITSDLRYAYLGESITNEAGQGNCVGAGGAFIGYDFSDSCLKIVLKYPRSTDYNYKVYELEPSGDLTVKEHRRCTISTQGNSRVLNCAESSPAGSLMTNGYKAETINPLLSGKDPREASLGTYSPFLRLSLTIKPIEITEPCSTQTVKPKCYSISTTITTGATQ